MVTGFSFLVLSKKKKKKKKKELPNVSKEQKSYLQVENPTRFIMQATERIM
ncbi:hypothetical protein HanPI659440_Chr03g0132061 [Helianthus annuus]|nr:hypothetical protein HanPI659440_Chr03g0132061 [Helianthus annuus]